MPIYAYRCSTCGHAQDVLQKMSDPLLTVCPACGASTYVKQVTAAGFQLKGSGWYVTDFRGDSKAGKSDDGGKGEGDKKAPTGEAGTSGEAAKSGDAGAKSDTGTAGAPAPAPAAAPAAAASAPGPAPAPAPSTPSSKTPT